MCISIPRWHLWFELKEHQMFRKLRNNLKIVRSLRTISNCFFLFLGTIIAVSLTNVRMIWTKPCSLQERHGKITLFIVLRFPQRLFFPILRKSHSNNINIWIFFQQNIYLIAESIRWIDNVQEILNYLSVKDTNSHSTYNN